MGERNEFECIKCRSRAMHITCRHMSVHERKAKSDSRLPQAYYILTFLLFASLYRIKCQKTRESSEGGTALPSKLFLPFEKVSTEGSEALSSGKMLKASAVVRIDGI